MGQVSCFECAVCSLYTPQDDDIYVDGVRVARSTRITTHAMEQSLMDQEEGNVIENPLSNSDMTISSRLGVSLSHWSDFIMYHGGEEFFREARVFEVYERIVYPLTAKQQLSYCDYLHAQDVKYVGIAEVYVTATWEDRFIDVWKALKYKFHSTEHYRDVFIFFPLFSYNFHRLGVFSRVPEKAFETTNLKLFEEYYSQQILTVDEKDGVTHQLRKANNEDAAAASLNQFLLEGPWILRNTIVHLHPWDKPMAFQRLSVVFDIFATLLMYGNIEFSITEESAKHLIKAIRETPATVIKSLLRCISSENSVVTAAVLHELLENNSPAGIVFQHSIENAENQGKVLRLIANTMTLEELNFEILKRLISFIIDLLRKEFANQSISLEEILNIELRLARYIRRFVMNERNQEMGKSHGIIKSNEKDLGMMDGYYGLDLNSYSDNSARSSPSTVPSPTSSFRPTSVGNSSRRSTSWSIDLQQELLIQEQQKKQEEQLSQQVSRQSLLAEGMMSSTLFFCEDQVGKDDFLTLHCIKQICDYYVLYGDIQTNENQSKKDSDNSKHDQVMDFLNGEDDEIDVLDSALEEEEKDNGDPDLTNSTSSKAELVLLEHYEDYLNRLGKEHPISIRCQLYYGDFLLLHNNKFNHAESIIVESYEIAKHCLNENNADLLHILHNLVRVYRKLSKLEEAQEYGLLCLKKFRMLRGNEHTETLTIMIELGIIYEELGQLNEARSLFKEAYEKSQRVLGILHPFTILTTYCLGMLYSKLQNFDRAQHFLYLFLMHHNVAIHERDIRIQHAILAMVKTFEYQEEFQKCIDWLYKLMRIYGVAGENSSTTGNGASPSLGTPIASMSPLTLIESTSSTSLSGRDGQGSQHSIPLPMSSSTKTVKDLDSPPKEYLEREKDFFSTKSTARSSITNHGPRHRSSISSTNSPISSIGNLEEWFARDSTRITTGGAIGPHGRRPSLVSEEGSSEELTFRNPKSPCWHFEDPQTLSVYCTREIHKFEKRIARKSLAFEVHTTTSSV